MLYDTVSMILIGISQDSIMTYNEQKQQLSIFLFTRHVKMLNTHLNNCF